MATYTITEAGWVPDLTVLHTMQHMRRGDTYRHGSADRYGARVVYRAPKERA